ncbi:protein bark beetle-like [Amphiura filiformis]|uniref:protein bark beetle-like n=1 Tax=Amphiura filiformis TaxID=82378 RepID=UPI003B21BCF1
MGVKTIHRALFSALISILLFHSASSQSEIGGNITEDATLDISGSPYNVTSTLVIHSNVTLLVDPGVELHFQPNVGAVVRGSLIANGTETDRIKFTGLDGNRSVPIGYHQIRLVDGPTFNEGRLEVFFNGQWGTVCDDYWGSSDSMVACRQLGYLSGSATYSYRYGTTGPIWLDDVGCSGDELVLWNCNHNGIGVHNCGSQYYFLESVLSYTDIEYAGFFFDDDTLQYTILPAITASGIPPFLDNVSVENNFGDGVKFSDLSAETAIIDSRIARNSATGLHVSTVGIGKLYVDGTDISDNGGFGIDYGGNTHPEDSQHYKFCGYGMSVDKYIYLDHATNDFINPNECVQIFQSPPGTTLTAYLVSGSGYSYYSSLEFWNGNTTDDLLASLELYEINGELITTTTNSLRVRVYRDYYYHTSFTLLITVQEDGLDQILFQGNTLANNTCEVVLRIESGVSGVGIIFNISQNTLVDNIPYPFFHREAPFLPVAVVSFDKPNVLFKENIIENPLFPLQLIITGDNFGSHVTADLNWWGTSDEIQIQEYIWDRQDRYEFATIDYFPFLLSADLTDVISPNATRYAVPFVRDDVIGGVVQGNVSLLNGDYYVDRDISIPQSSVLRISSGATLRFSPFSAIFVRGKLIADGNTNHEISFEPHSVTSDNTVSSNATTIRLVDGSTAWEGRLELFVEGEWHSVCGNYWTQENARVACRQLGYSDVLNGYFYPNQPGTGPILNYPVACKGKELDLLDCKPKEDATAWCTSHSYDVSIQCRRPQWAGLVFPANNAVSVLRHVTIEHAGYRHDTNSIISTGAMVVHLHHHEFHNLDILSSSKGVKMLYADPFHAIRPLSTISITNCTGYAFECYSDGVHLENWNIHNCYETYVSPTTNMHTELVKWVEPHDKISTCHLNKTLDLEDSLILSPPLSGSRSCYGIFTISNIYSNGRVGVFVLYSSDYARITVEEQGQTILSISGSTPHDNSVVSEGSTITIQHQPSYSSYYYLFYLIVKGVEGSTEVPTRKQLDTFTITNTNIVHILSSPYGMYFDPSQWTEIIASDVTIKCSSSWYCIYFSRAFEKLSLYKADLTDAFYGLQVYTTPLVISQSSFYDMHVGIDFSGGTAIISNRTMTIEDTRFGSMSQALYIADSYSANVAANIAVHWLIRNCTFSNAQYEGIIISSRSSISSNMVIPRFTIESCDFFETFETTIYVSYGTVFNILISNNIFRENQGTIVNIERADTYSSLSVINNIFEANEAKVLRVPNELPRCHIKDNVFLNNSAPYIVEYFERVPLSSAMTSDFEHIFHGNSLTGNFPTGTSGDHGLTCTIITRHLSGIFQYNIFENEGFLFEFCIGRFTFYNVSASLDATFNDWNAGNDSEIAQKIFDINDWNDRPGVTFSPSLTSESNSLGISLHDSLGESQPLGGMLLQDETLTASESPYFVRSDITIPDNVTLTIGQGVEMRFAPNIGILVMGSLIARGSYNDRIVMTAANLNYTDISWGNIRLQDGPSLWHGRLEIYLNGEWGTVCDDYWDSNDARVVCRQLGMGSPVSYLSRDFTGTPPDRIWLDDVRCTGSETMLSGCPSRGVGIHDCGHHEDVGLECENGLWGGIRIIGNQEVDEPKSILEYVDIINTGYLHNEPYPGLFIRHASPQINNVNILNSSSDGILTDTPVTDFKLQNVTVKNTKSGVVLLKVGNVMLDLDNVTTVENKETGLVVHEEDDNSAFSLCYFKTIPICGPETENLIMVDRSADLHLHNPPKQNYGSATCTVLIQSIRNETLVLQVYIPPKYWYNYINIYDHETSKHLGTATYYYAYHVTVVSPPETRTLRIYSYHAQRYGQEAYIRITTSDKNRLVKHTIRDSIVAENKRGGITYNIVPNGLIYGVSTMLPYSCRIYIERCQFLSNEASVGDHVIAFRINGESRFNMENCLMNGNTKLGGIELYLDDDSYSNKTMHRILNNEFKYNTQGEGMVFVEGIGSNLGDFIQIHGNLLLHNTPIDTASMVEFNGVYVNLDSNTAYNNTGKRLLLIKQGTIPPEPQECTNNLIAYNLGQFSTEKYTIEVGASGIQFHNNVLQNPANDYEMNAISGSGIINATHNWWGTTSAYRIGNSLRDSDIVIGNPDIIFEPYLFSSPSHVESRVKCPNNCYGKGVCHGTTCVCSKGWKGDDCAEFHCQDVKDCSGFGTCVGPNQCKCRAGWQG